ncbi:recombinase family protein [Ruegeria marina]|uniref:Site-specific DNA recombinase n=1 Tax=Ruegeria marina TaxID=639004 RepID=A0A1G6YE87_9RHOB|nr:recombinase family protein [Ruegeria marina]SDD88678.1 Site-specific DNA recombinase [Ruegeria marina]
MVNNADPPLKLIAYERVSTEKQGRSGLGLEAQRKAIDDFAESRGGTVLARFTEIESGRKTDRPKLTEALALTRLTGATLVIAKLDRLSRNAAFLLTLRDSGVKFLACDMPEANNLTVGIMALVAEQEREAISRRTKEALAAAKARGVRLGNPKGAAALRRAGKGGSPLRAAVQENASAFAQELAPVIDDIRSQGHVTLRAMAAELNARGIRTRRGGRWHVSNVRNLVERQNLARGGGASPSFS